MVNETAEERGAVKELLQAWAIEIELLLVFVLPLVLIVKGLSDLRENKRRRERGRSPGEGEQ